MGKQTIYYFIEPQYGSMLQLLNERFPGESAGGGKGRNGKSFLSFSMSVCLTKRRILTSYSIDVFHVLVVERRQ